MHLKYIITTLIIIFLTFINAAAQKDRVLFTLDGENVYTSEFSRVFEKNRLLLNKASQSNVEDYLELSINYKLKIKEAYNRRMDMFSSYKKELDEVKGKIVGDYQNFLEKEWLVTLKEKYPVKVNKKSLKRIDKKV